jgi:hypothetical protein
MFQSIFKLIVTMDGCYLLLYLVNNPEENPKDLWAVEREAPRRNTGGTFLNRSVVSRTFFRYKSFERTADAADTDGERSDPQERCR